MKLPVILASYMILATWKFNIGDSDLLHRHDRRYLPNGQYCIIRTRKDACWFDNEIRDCDRNGTMDQCVPCKPGYRNCIRPTSDLDVKCTRPELQCKPEEMLVVVDLRAGGCLITCPCNKTAGYIRKDQECVPHHIPCGINSTLHDDTCTGCPSGMYKPWIGFQDCILIPKSEDLTVSMPTPPSLEPSHSSPILPKINESLPVFSPVNLTVTAISSTKIFLQWHKPGLVTKYTVFLKASNDINDQRKEDVYGNHDIMNKTLNGLTPSTVYTAFVTAILNHDATVKSKTLRVTTKDQDYPFDGQQENSQNFGTWQIVVTAIGCVIVVLIIIIIIIIASYCRSKKKDTPNIFKTNIFNVNQCGHPSASEPPPPYSVGSDNNISSNEPSVNTLLDIPPLISESSSLINCRHQSRESSSSGPDTTACKQTVPADPSAAKHYHQKNPLPSPNQTSRKLPVCRQEAGAVSENESLLSNQDGGGGNSEFGPYAMKFKGKK